MANSDKNILITPNVGSSTADPKIVFSGADASTGPQNITVQIYPTNGGTLSFEGSAGQLFSVTNSMSGTIYSVNDVSGIPSIEVLDTGLVKLAQYSGNVLLGTGTDNGTDKLQVNGSILGTTIKGSTFTSTVATGTAPLSVTSTTVVNNLNADLWDGYQFASYLNQGVRTSDGPTFGEVYNNGWFRSNSNNTGLYNSNTTQHWSSTTNGYWDASSTTTFSSIRLYTGGHMSAMRGGIYANSSNEVGFIDNASNWTLRMSGGVAYATTFSGALSGNATTATTLQTARSINGTSFNGSADITTANWGTTRTLTIGSTGKSVNGSGDVSWSLAEIGAAASSHTHSYLPLSGGTMSGTIDFSTTNTGVTWTMNTDAAYIKFFNTGNGDTDSRLEYATADDSNEYHRWMISSNEKMNLKNDALNVTVGKVTVGSTSTYMIRNGTTGALEFYV